MVYCKRINIYLHRLRPPRAYVSTLLTPVTYGKHFYALLQISESQPNAAHNANTTATGVGAGDNLLNTWYTAARNCWG